MMKITHIVPMRKTTIILLLSSSVQSVVWVSIILFIICSSSSSSSSSSSRSVHAQDTNDFQSDSPSLVLGTLEPSDIDSDLVSTIQVGVENENENDVDDDVNVNVTIDGLNETLRAKFVQVPEQLAVVGQYIVSFNKTIVTQVKEQIQQYLDEKGINVTKAYESIRCAKIQLVQQYGNGTTTSERYISLIRRLLESDAVLFVEEDQIVNLTQYTTSPTTSPTPSPTPTMTVDNQSNKSTSTDGFILNQQYPPWGLDRIDQPFLPLNKLYHSDISGENVTAFILDTGLLPTHEEFEDRASCVYSSVKGEDCMDGNGHGTHVAGIIGGKTYGVAKKVELVGVKVLPNTGAGTMSGLMDGMNYVLEQKEQNGITARYVVNFSLAGFMSRALDNAVEDLVHAGIFVAAAAGNSNVDACTTSPARSNASFTVASTDRNDRRSSYSNWGPCVQLFAPGSDIQSAWYTSNTATNTISGTSMATPHVTGVAALYLSANPFILPRTISAYLIADSTESVTSDSNTIPNYFLNTQALFQTTPATPPSSSAQSIVIAAYNRNMPMLLWSSHTATASLFVITSILFW